MEWNDAEWAMAKISLNSRAASQEIETYSENPGMTGMFYNLRFKELTQMVRKIRFNLEKHYLKVRTYMFKSLF